jgi:hypothetical protein
MDTNTKKRNGLMAKKHSVFRSLLGAAGITAAVLLSTGCSIQSSDIGLTDISINDSNQVTATVTIDNIDIENFKTGDTTLSTIRLYYAYTDDKKSALEDSNVAGKDPVIETIEVSEDLCDGSYIYNVPAADVVDFKNGTATSYAKTLTFELSEEAKGKDIDFLVVLDGTDFNDDGYSMSPSSGSASSQIISYSEKASVTYAQEGEDFTSETETDNIASLWSIEVTPGTAAITSLGVKVKDNGGTFHGTDEVYNTPAVSKGTIVAGVVVNHAAADVAGITAVVNGEDIAATAAE